MAGLRGSSVRRGVVRSVHGRLPDGARVGTKTRLNARGVGRCGTAPAPRSRIDADAPLVPGRRIDGLLEGEPLGPGRARLLVVLVVHVVLGVRLMLHGELRSVARRQAYPAAAATIRDAR